MIQTGRYRHFKGLLYQVLGQARHSETLEDMVIYQALYGTYGIWVRPVAMFIEHVLHEANTVPRFKYLGPISEAG